MISHELREYASALDTDRGHDKSRVTALMRQAATLIDAHRAEFLRTAKLMDEEFDGLGEAACRQALEDFETEALSA